MFMSGLILFLHLNDECSFDVYCTYRAHLVTAIALDALGIIDDSPALVLVYGNCMLRTAFGTFAAAYAFLFVYDRAWGNDSFAATDNRLEEFWKIINYVLCL